MDALRPYAIDYIVNGDESVAELNVLILLNKH